MRLEPNALLAVTTGCSLGLLIGSAAIFGEPGNLFKYLVIAIVVAAICQPLKKLMQRRMNVAPSAIITLESPRSAMWATLYPAAITLMALIPMFWTGHDYGLLVIIAAVWFGTTINSALVARKTAH